MSRLLRISVIFTLLFSVSSITLGEDRDEVANKFYSDLTNIIESNKNNPERVTREIERYCELNERPLERMRQPVERELRSIKNYQQPNSNNTETGQTLPEENLIDTVSRFSDAFTTFSKSYPDQAQEINNTIEQVAPNYKSY